MAPTKQTAAIIAESGKSVELRQVDVPKPGAGEILVKVDVAALNPIDWKMAEWGAAAGASQPGKVSGCDVAGVVEELGPGAEAHVKKGDRVAVFVYGATNPTNGGFAQYLVAKADIALHIPASLSSEDAAQLPIAVFTASQTLYQSLGLNVLPQPAASEPTSILIYGASSAVGTYNVQLAKLGGLKVYATASPKNFDLVRSFGADEVFDYKDPEAAKKIKEATGGKLKLAVDSISDNGSDKFISAALSDAGGKIAVVRPYASPRDGVEAIHSLAYDFLVDRKEIGKSYLADGPKYAKFANDLLAQGKIKTAPTVVAPKGLASINDEFKNMKEGKVSGQKVVFRISDTPSL